MELFSPLSYSAACEWPVSFPGTKHSVTHKNKCLRVFVAAITDLQICFSRYEGRSTDLDLDVIFIHGFKAIFQIKYQFLI